MKNLWNLFDDPPREMYGAPFWAWNAKLEENTLRQQIKVMKKMGFGGFFMHSRTGLDTAYLSEDWFKAIDICIDEAEKQDMLAYLYDEDRWPSGAAGGFVTADDRFKARKLYCSENEVPPGGLFLAAFAITLKNGTIASMRRLADGENASGDEKKYNFYRLLMESSTWYNNAAYLDTMNQAAVSRFIEVTHQQYALRYQDKFSRSVPAMFTDEPCYIHGDVNGCLPWTDSICDEFRKRYGYELLDRIPELFFATQNEVSEVRHDFYDLIGSLFAENFCGLIAQWGDNYKLPLCGHLLGEDALSSQTLYIGNAMRCYEKMQIPGVDVLTEHWNIFNTVKQVASAAHQLGKKYRMTETYGCTGWDFPLYGHKAIGDWQYALGINMRCLHLTWYSMAGEGKRDYPASFSDHSPWYEKYPVLEKYFARLGAVSLCTEEVRDLLVIHPIESLWSVMVKDIPTDAQNMSNRTIQPGRKVLDYFDSPLVNQLDKAHTDLTNLLLRENLDFDFGDEEMMSRIARIDGRELIVGKARYRQILIPELKTIRSSTLKLLSEFKGRIFYLGEPPRFVDAKLSDKAAAVYAAFTPVSMENAASEISGDFRRVSITENERDQAASVLYRLGANDDAYTFFIANTSMLFEPDMKNAPMVRERKIAFPELNITLELPFKGEILELDPATGTKTFIDHSYYDGKYHFNTSLDIVGSRLFLISADCQNGCKAENTGDVEAEIKPFPSESFAYSLSEPNIMVLDHAAWETPFGSSDVPEYIITLDDKLRAMMGEAPRGGKMEQPWHRKDDGNAPHMPIKLFYTFECKEIPDCEYLLTLENPEKFNITLNDRPLVQEKCQYYLDEALINLKLDRDLLKKGTNKLVIECEHFDRRTELEAILLRGYFGVDTKNRICTLPERLNFGDWCSQGLPNYAGNVNYHTVFENQYPHILNFNDWQGTLLGIKINDQEEKLLVWYPFSCTAPAGKYDLTITVYGHRRNALGPFYLNEKWPDRTGPYQFKVYDSPERQLVPCGLLSPFEIIQKNHNN